MTRISYTREFKVEAEVPAQGIAAHSSDEGLVEFGEVDGRYRHLISGGILKNYS